MLIPILSLQAYENSLKSHVQKNRWNLSFQQILIIEYDSKKTPYFDVGPD